MNRNEMFYTRIHLLSAYARENGHCDIPLSFHTRDHAGERIALGRWASYIKGRYRAGLLTVEQARGFEAIPGWDWDARLPGARKKVALHTRVHELRAKRHSLQQIADQVNLSRQRVHQILNGKKR